MKAKTSARDKGIFVRHNVDFVPKGSLTHLRVQNEMMLMVLSGRKLQHIRLQNAKTTDIPVPLSEQDRIANIFLDYNGAHAIVSTSTGENFYLNMRSVQLKPLKRFKGTVTAVGWNLEYSRESETGFIVLGTNKGQLTETNISANGTMAYVKTLVNDVSEDKAFAVTDLQMHQQSEDTIDRWILLVCTTGRLYVLAGAVDIKAATQPQPQPVVGTVWSAVMVEQPGGVLQPLFNTRDHTAFLSLNSEKHIPPSELAVYPIVSGEPPKYYCWLSSEGLRLGSIDVSKAGADVSKAGADVSKAGTDMSKAGADVSKTGAGTMMLTEEAQLEHKRVEGRFDYPLDIAMTEYHLLMLHSDRFVAVSRLNQKTAFEDNFDAKTIALGMCRDASSQFIWIFTESSIFKYRPFDETRHVWRIYLERNEFAKAQVITSQMQDQGPYQIVIKKEAEKFIAEKNYAAAAELLAQSTDPFENTVLMFLRGGTSKEGRMGLKRFLELKLNPMNRSEDKIKRDILVIWLLEIQLGELAELRRSHNQAVASDQPEQASMSTSRDAELNKLRHELSSFLNRPIVYESISENRAAIYRLITSHADFETQLNLATKLKDYPVAIKVHMLTKNYAEALKLLASYGNAKMFYEYAPDLMQETPGELVAVLIEKERMLRPSEILPAFYELVHPPESNEEGLKSEEKSKKASEGSGRMVDAAFKYLQHVIESGRADQNVHDFTVKLYAKYKPNALLEHLKKFGKSRADVPYDVSAALRICADKALKECQVFLYCVEGLYEEAVKLALTIRLDLAKECALELNQKFGQANDFSPDDLFADPDSMPSEETRKRVWMEIAKHMIAASPNDVQAPLQLLKESGEAIKIQDILSYFPEFTKIEHFKEPVCDCLKEHSRKIQDLQQEMKEANEMAQEIRRQLEKAKTKFMVVKAQDTCTKCKELLLTRPFYAFVCRHFFHKECLYAYLQEFFNEQEKVLLERLTRDEKIFKKEVEMKAGPEKVSASKRLKVVQDKLKTLIADDCPACGARMIESIDKPFFSDDEYRQELDTWTF